MKNRRVLIVGGAGLTGRAIVKRLAARGAVIAVASRRAVDAGFLRPMGDVGQITAVDVGIGEEAALAPLIANSDIVISCAGAVTQSRRNSFDLIHHRGPAMLARHAAAAGVRRFLHFSALGADPASASPYSQSKAEGEAAVQAAFPGATIVRPSLIFGPEDQFFNRLAALARIAPVIPLVDGGHTRFQPVFVDDVADAVVAALGRSDTEGKIYELGGPEILTFREMAERLLHEIGRTRLLVPLPSGIAMFLAFFLELLPDAPLTRDEVRLTGGDFTVRPGMPGFKTFKIAPTALDLVLPSYVERFRRGGRFALATPSIN